MDDFIFSVPIPLIWASFYESEKRIYDDCIKIFEFYIDNKAILVSLKSQFKNAFYLTGERGTFSLYLIINRIEIDYKNYQIIESN